MMVGSNHRCARWRVRLFVLVAVLVAAMSAGPAMAAPTVGTNFDGIMSLIYDDLTGNVFIENSPVLPNPSVQQLVLASAGGFFNPGNLTFPSLSPVVTINSATANLIDIEWSSGNFLGTGSFLGDILGIGLPQLSLLTDLTILYAPAGASLVSGDLIHGSFGNLQSDPTLPGNPDPDGNSGFFRFFDVDSGQFMDPPWADGFIYKMDSASLFTKIGFPIGYGDNFEVVVGGVTVASGLAGGSQFIFGGGGVTDFTVLGIAPMVDAALPNAFPLYMEFDTSVASFNMTAVPEPATMSLLAIGGIALLRRRARRGEK